MFLVGITVLGIFSAIVMLLWNLLIPGIFGLISINFWQALGLLILARILFGGFGGMKNKAGFMSHENNPIREKWMKMTPEQQKEFINHRKQFGFGGPFGRDGFFGRESCNDGGNKNTKNGNE